MKSPERIKIILLVLLAGLNSFAFGQKKHKDPWFPILLETQIQPFLEDSSGTATTNWESDNYVTVSATNFRQAVAKTWNLANGEILVGLLLNEVDNVMNHQQVKFFFYKNQQLEPAHLQPPLYLASFFDEDYLAQKNISPSEYPEDPVFVFFPANNKISVHLQPEVFDTTYMGQTDLTRLDPDQMTVTEVVFVPGENGELNLASRKYPLGVNFELETLYGWEMGCTLSAQFIPMGNDRYFFSSPMSMSIPNEMRLVVDEDCDSIKVTRRVAFAYGKLRSETEGMAFYDTSFAGNRDMPWYTFSDFFPVKLDTGCVFGITATLPPNTLLKTPGISPKLAEAWFRKESPDDFDLAPGLDEATRKTKRLKLYAYLVEVDISFLKAGQQVKKTLFFKLMRGEC